MRRRIAALGALLLILAVFLYTNSTADYLLSSDLGAASNETVNDRTMVVQLAPQNASSVQVKLNPGDSLAAVVKADPGNVDIFLMNQGNFSQWSNGRGSASVYSQSVLGVSNYSLTFSSQEPAQNFYLVFVSHSVNQVTDVMVHTVVNRLSEVSILLFPAVFGLVGIVLLGFPVKTKTRRPGSRGTTAPEELRQTSDSIPVGPEFVFCRHCGAAMRSRSQFCPSCNTSQT